jgi:hypothetical protein
MYAKYTPSSPNFVHVKICSSKIKKWVVGMRGFGNTEFLPIGLIGLIAPYSEVLIFGCWLWDEIAYLYLRFA